MAHRQVAATLLAVGVAAVLAGCGDNYDRGAGVLTIPTTTQPAPAAVTTTVSAAPAQTTDAGGTESSEAAPLTAAQRRTVRAASRAARAFLRGYLPYSYGQATAKAIRAAAPALRDELARRPPRVPPALADRARPRLKRLRVNGLAGGKVFLLADVDDGSSRYAALLELRQRDGRWLVTRVQ